jgi:anti-anti-sigma factor
MALTLADAEIDGMKILRLAGRLDSGSERSAQEHILAAAQDGRNALLLDVSAVDYVSSAGLRVLVLAAKRAGSLRMQIGLCGVRENLLELLEISDLVDVFRLHPSAEIAVLALKGQ